MGLCKCPKKKVTNLFCFEHKVNVCEHCLVADHDKCIVKSYLQWLEDSDYHSICNICEKQLQIDDLECIRLICYDVFHLQCLNEMASQLPETTAPAGYECPVCKKSIIPHQNQAGPLVENLKQKISKSQWFLRSLRLKSPHDDNDVENFEIIERNQSESERKLLDNLAEERTNGHKIGREIPASDDQLNQISVTTDIHEENKSHSVYQMPDVDQSPNIRKCFTNSRMPELPSAVVYSDIKRNDEENKYSRKSLVTHISTLIKAYFPLSTSRRSPQKAYRYFILTLIIGIILFIFLLWLFSILGRYSSDQDPMLDPRYNPNLEFVQDQQLVRSVKDDKDGLIVRGAVNNIEAPSHGR